MQEILESLTVNEFLVKVNHRKILEAVVLESGCNNDLFKTICSSIDKLDKLSWSEVRAELLTKGINEEQADIIGNLTTFKGDPLKLLDEIISKNVFKKNAEFLESTFADMRKLFTYLTAMNRIGKVSFDLSLARGLDYYTGLIYEIVLTDKTTELGSISGGGRYDNLIGMFSQYQIPSVGGSIGIERLFTILEGKFKDKVKQNACEVLVASIGKVEVK
jgi:histidyl-tRNA synthetase